MGVPRTRVIWKHQDVGITRHIGGSVYYDAIPPRRELITDISPGWVQDDHLTVLKETVTGGRLNGNSAGNWLLENTPVDRYAGGVLPVPDLPGVDLNALAYKVIAETNPSKAQVDVPALLWELPDLTGILQAAGRNAFHRFSESYIKTKFGVMPLIHDVVNLAFFAEETAKRMRFLKRAQSHGSSIGKVKLFTSRWESAERVLLNSSRQTFIYATEVVTNKVERWGFCRWTPQGNFPSAETEMRLRLQKAISGLNFNNMSLLRTSWELIPWSWLIDWFSTIGDAIAASENVLDMTPGTPCVCQHMTTTMVTKDISVDRYPHVQMTPLKYVGVLKTRRPRSPVLSATIPLLDDGQLSILGALTNLRTLPRF